MAGRNGNNDSSKCNEELIQTLRAILGSETSEMDIIRALHLAKNDIAAAANIILDSRILALPNSNGNSNMRPQSSTAAKAAARASGSSIRSSSSIDRVVVQERKMLTQCRGSDEASGLGRVDWWELGSAHVTGFSTSRGRKLLAGEPLDFNFPRQVKAGPTSKLFGRGRSPAAASCSEIVRFSTREAGEIGRIPTEWARCLIPLVNSRKIKVEGHCISAVSNLGLMDNILLSISVFINRALFCNLSQDSSELRRPSTDDSVFHPLPILLKLLGKEPVKKAAFTPDDLYSRKRSFESKGTSVVPVQLLPPEKRRKVSDGSVVEGEGEDCLSDSDLNQLVGTSESCHLEEMDPPLTLQCDLRPYQKQALNWMTNLERGVEREEAAKTLHPCWNAYDLPDERGGAIYVNSFSGDGTTEFPSALQLARGGILADAMGLGKTVMTIALLLSNTSKGGLSNEHCTANPDESNGRDKCCSDSNGTGTVLEPSHCSSKLQGMNTNNSSRRIHKGGKNLIVCPMTLLGQWKTEIETHAQAGAMSVYVYYGQSRTKDIKSLLQHDVVLTTYGVLASEYQPESSQDEGVLHSIQWFRVVLDEAHTIKSPKSQTSLAAYALVADCRWCLTGTPIQNNLEDVYSLLRFLRVEPWRNWGWWYKLVQKPFEEGDNRGLNLVKAILQPLMLRRTKDSTDKEGRPILVLPPTDVQVVYCELTQCERDFYDALYKKSKVKFDQFVEQGKVLHNYASILELLLRLRQCCDHPFLVMSRGDTQEYADLNKLARRFLKQGQHPPDGDSGAVLSKAYIHEVVAELSKGEKGECPICLEAVEDAVFTPCAHCMCRECLLASWRNASSGSCPICRTSLARQDLITVPSESRFHVDVDKNWTESTKITVLFQQLEELRSSGSKSVVFSQWTAFLDLLQIPLSRKNIPFVRLDGTLSQPQRERVIQEFTENASVLVMLISLKSGGVGINLTAASNAFLLDPWWNPAVEEQAIMRIHRIGQTKRVSIKRFIVKDTVEERLQQVQARKQRMISGALTDEEVRSARIEELKMLFR